MVVIIEEKYGCCVRQGVFSRNKHDCMYIADTASNQDPRQICNGGGQRWPSQTKLPPPFDKSTVPRAIGWVFVPLGLNPLLNDAKAMLVITGHRAIVARWARRAIERPSAEVDDVPTRRIVGPRIDILADQEGADNINISAVCGKQTVCLLLVNNKAISYNLHALDGHLIICKKQVRLAVEQWMAGIKRGGYGRYFVAVEDATG